MDTAMLLLRLTVGLYVAAHGAQKLFGWFGGPGFVSTEALFGGIFGYRPAWLWTLAACLAEFGGGLLMVLGMFEPLGSIAVAGAMLSATVINASHGPWAADNGVELPLVYLIVAVAVALVGPGSFSLDGSLGITFPTVYREALAMLALVSLLVGLVTRHVPTALPQAKA